MTKELAGHIHNLRKQVSSISTVNADRVVEDAEVIVEANGELDEVNQRVRVTMNAWNTDLDVDNDEIDAFLNESESEDERVTVEAAKERPVDKQNKEDNKIVDKDVFKVAPKVSDDMRRVRFAPTPINHTF